MELDVFQDEELVELAKQAGEEPQNSWRWHLKAGNGRITQASSEGFDSKWNAERNYLQFMDEAYSAFTVYRHANRTPPPIDQPVI